MAEEFVFSKLDLFAGCWNIRLVRHVQKMIIFIVSLGHSIFCDAIWANGYPDNVSAHGYDPV